MRFSELISFKLNDPENIKRLSNIGALSFGKGLSDKNADRTPHYEIDEALKAYETMPIINSAVEQLISFIIPNKEIKIASKDKKTVDFLEKWHKERDDIIEEMKNILITNTISGNGMAENFYAETTDGKKVYDNMFSMNDVSRIYVNPDDIDGPEAFIFQLPVGIKIFKYMGIEQTPGFYMVKYIKNYNFTFKRVYGIPIPGWKFTHYKTGWSRDNLYGRSQLTSAIDAVKIFQQIMSSWDTIAKTRQIDQKLISLSDSENSNVMYDDKQIEALEQKLNDSDNSYNIIGLPLKMLQTDISVSQGFNLMESAVDVLRRQIMMSLLPQHLTPWNDSATTQGSESAMPPFMLRLKSKQNSFIKYMNKTIINKLRATYTWLAEDATYVFDEPKVMPDDFYVTKMLELVGAEVVTTQEAKEYFKKMGILDEEIFESIEDNSEKEPEDNGEEKPEAPEKKREEKISEALKNVEIGFSIFKRRLNMRYKKKPFSTSTWKEISSDEVGGHQVRLINSNAGIYLLFDGLNMVESYDTDITNLLQAKRNFEVYKQKIKESFDQIMEGETPEDIMFDELQKEIEVEYTKRLSKFFKQIDRKTNKKEKLAEGFLSGKIFPSLDSVFKGFNTFINSRVNNIMKKFNVSVIKAKDDGTLDTKTQDMLKQKNNLMAKNLSNNLKQVKDTQVQSIRNKLSMGIAAGQDIKDIKANIEKDFDYDKGVKYKIDRAIQTSGRNSVRITKLKKYKAMGFDEIVWITRDDNKVRQQHKKLNNHVYPIDKVMAWLVNNTLPGTIYNCRCTFIPY